MAPHSLPAGVAPVVERLAFRTVKPGAVGRFRVVMTENATGNQTTVPAMVVRAPVDGPVVGVTAAIHGNELNGIPVIHRLLEVLRKHTLKKGAIVAVPMINVPGYLRQQREFEDGTDLNRIMPGKADGNESELYARRFVDRVLGEFDYLVDLHTASFGRVNSLYVRADMTDPITANMARLVAPQIIVHNPGADGTLRSAAADLGIHAITVEVGDPQRLQPGLVRSTRLGVQGILQDLGMLEDISDPDREEIVECKRSFWCYTDCGGILSVLPPVAAHVNKGDVIARLRNVWGDTAAEYRAPADAIVVGKSTNPSARAGSRIAHLGIIGEP